MTKREQTPSERAQQRWHDFRDAALFMGGIGGVFHETVIQTGERPTLLILFAAMMGLPAFLRADDARGKAPEEEK